jgi:hypothetical protein
MATAHAKAEHPTTRMERGQNLTRQYVTGVLGPDCRVLARRVYRAICTLTTKAAMIKRRCGYYVLDDVDVQEVEYKI